MVRVSIFRELIRLWLSRSDSPRPKNKTDPFPTGLDTKKTTRSDTMPREETGESPSSASIDHRRIFKHSIFVSSRDIALTSVGTEYCFCDRVMGDFGQAIDWFITIIQRLIKEAKDKS